MDKKLLFNELYDSIDSRKHFIRVVKQATDMAIEDYTGTLKQLEDEGKIMCEECRLHNDTFGSLIKMRGWIR